MGLMDILMSSAGSSLVGKVASMANLDEGGSKSLINMISGELLSHTKEKIAGNEDSSMLEAAINGSKYLGMLESPNLDDKETGNSILEMITGSKDKSRNIAANVAKSSGVDLSVIKNLLPVVAPMLLGSMSKRNSETGSDVSILGMLDMDGDGSALDDVMGFAQKFL